MRQLARVLNSPGVLGMLALLAIPIARAAYTGQMVIGTVAICGAVAAGVIVARLRHG
jgi:hypothetical protein